MAKKVLSLKVVPIPEERRRSVLRVLANARERALRGELRGVLVVAATDEASIEFWGSGGLGRSEQIGMLERFKDAILREDG